MHVTDIHCAYDKIDQLKQWLKDRQQKVDLVLISGDIANVPLELYRTASKEQLQEQHDNLQRIVDDFVAVASQVYFVPGNVRYPTGSRWPIAILLIFLIA